MGLSKTTDHIQIKIKMPNSSQEHPASSKGPNDDLILSISLLLKGKGYYKITGEKILIYKMDRELT